MRSRCPICKRNIYGKRCPIHGNVTGGGRAQEYDRVARLGISNLETAITDVTDDITGVNSSINQKTPVDTVIAWIGDIEGTLPEGWAYTGKTMKDPSTSEVIAYYLKYTGVV